MFLYCVLSSSLKNDDHIFCFFFPETSIRSNDWKQQTICWPRYFLTIIFSLNSSEHKRCAVFTKTTVVQTPFQLYLVKEQQYSLFCPFVRMERFSTTIMSHRLKLFFTSVDFTVHQDPF